MKHLPASVLVLIALAFPPFGAGADESRASPPSGMPAPVIFQPEELEQIVGLQQVTLEWSSVPGAAHYHYLLARDRSFLNVSLEGTAYEGTSVVIPALDYGTYFFKVRAVAPDGSKGPFTEKVSFIIVPDPRPLPPEKQSHTSPG